MQNSTFSLAKAQTAHMVAFIPMVDSVEYLYVNLEASVFKEPLRIDKGLFQFPRDLGWLWKSMKMF